MNDFFGVYYGYIEPPPVEGEAGGGIGMRDEVLRLRCCFAQDDEWSEASIANNQNAIAKSFLK